MAYRPENCINIVKPREKPFGCGSCDKSFDNAAQLAHHVIITHLKSIFVCKSCKKYSSKKPVELAIHEKLCRAKSNKGEDSENVGYRCCLCSKSCSSKRFLNLHLKFKHKIGDKYRNANVCQFCPKQFLTKHFLDEHVHNKHQN